MLSNEQGGAEASERASQHIAALETLSRQAAELANMDFTFLFDPVRDDPVYTAGIERVDVHGGGHGTPKCFLHLHRYRPFR